MPTVSTAYVLAAGLGTRLRPLTEERPKPLVEVCGTSLVELVLGLLDDAGIRRAALNSHWLHPQLPDKLGGRFRGIELTYTHEPEVLGTGGGLKGLVQALPPPAGERVLILNADALIDLDVRALLARDLDGALGALVLKEVPDVAAYGALGTDARDHIVTFAGRIKPRGEVARERMFCGVHVVDPKVLDVLPAVDVDDGVARGAQSGINDHGYPRWLEQGAVLFGVDHTGTFCDVGTPERLLEANLALLSGAWAATHLRPFARFEQRPGRVFVSPRARVHAGATLIGPCLVDDDAEVHAGARVGPLAVVGKGCAVRGSVAGVVLQSGARVDGDVVDAIVSPTCKIDVDPRIREQVSGVDGSRDRSVDPPGAPR